MTDEKQATTHGITPSQTIGPFFAYSLSPTAYDYTPLTSNNLVTADTVGERITIRGVLHDGAGAPVPDALVEIWQADGESRYAGIDTEPVSNRSFKGFGRSECDKLGTYVFTTVKPGAVPGPGGQPQAPHINVGIFARGLLLRLFTRIYFEDEQANAADPILALVPGDRRGTLLARRSENEAGVPVYILDIVLQGDDETVFFEA